MAGVYNFTIEQGTTYAEVFTWQQANGSAINLTGYTGRMQLRDRIVEGPLIAEISTALGTMTLGGAAGTITITVDAATTSSWSFQTAVYDLELTSAAGVVVRLLKGKIRLDPQVTR
jgi:hypothetical protein